LLTRFVTPIIRCQTVISDDQFSIRSLDLIYLWKSAQLREIDTFRVLCICQHRSSFHISTIFAGPRYSSLFRVSPDGRSTNSVMPRLEEQRQPFWISSHDIYTRNYFSRLLSFHLF
jgi:hypothetical protein